MTWQYVDVSLIDVTEPILPNNTNWENLTSYPFNAIDCAFLSETTIERFIDTQGKLPGGMRSRNDYPTSLKPWDDQPTKVLCSDPLLHVQNCMETRVSPETVNTMWIDPSTSLLDKEAYDFAPSYSELVEPIQLSEYSNSFLTGRGFVFQDLKNLYIDIRKFKRKQIPNGYRTTHTEELEIIHTNPLHPITDDSEGGTESAFFAWKRNRNTLDESGASDVIDTKYRRRAGNGLWIELRNVLNKDQLKDMKVLIEYEVHRWASRNTVEWGQSPQPVLDEYAYKCEWLDVGSIRELDGKKVIYIPEYYWSQGKCNSIIEHFFQGWSSPHNYTYDDDTKTSLYTSCCVNPGFRFVVGDMNLKTDF